MQHKRCNVNMGRGGFQPGRLQRDHDRELSRFDCQWEQQRGAEATVHG